MIEVAPAELNIDTFPAAPSLAMTRFGTVWAGTKLRFDAVGIGSPVGQTVMKPFPDGSVTVTLMTTLSASGATSWKPLIWTSIEAHAPPAAAGRPTPARVSSTRSGLSGVNRDAVSDWK